MKRTIQILTIFLSLQGCSPKLYPSSTQVIEKTETIKEIIRDTIIEVQPDSSIIQALIKCDSTGRARLQEINALKQSERLWQTISIQDTLLPYQPTSITVTTYVDSMGIYLTYKEKFKECIETREIETFIEKEVNILHWWQKALIWLGSISLAIGIILLIRRLK